LRQSGLVIDGIILKTHASVAPVMTEGSRSGSGSRPSRRTTRPSRL